MFQIKATIEPKRIDAILRYIEQKSWNLNPPYQRESVWAKDRKQLFIDSVLMGLPIPTMFVDTQVVNNTDRFDVVDGKQRCLTLVEFTKNLFPIALSEGSNIDPAYNGKFFKDLPPAIVTDFNEVVIPVHVIPHGPDSHTLKTARELFARLNNGMIVTAAEKIHSIAKPRIIEIATRIKGLMRNKKGRQKEFEIATTILIAALCDWVSTGTHKTLKIHSLGKDVMFQRGANNGSGDTQIMRFKKAASDRIEEMAEEDWNRVNKQLMGYEKQLEVVFGNYVFCKLPQGADPTAKTTGHVVKLGVLYEFIQVWMIRHRPLLMTDQTMRDAYSEWCTLSPSPSTLIEAVDSITKIMDKYWVQSNPYSVYMT